MFNEPGWGIRPFARRIRHKSPPNRLPKLLPRAPPTNLPGSKENWRSLTASVAKRATPENVASLEKHLAQFLALATGGPAQYDGKEMTPTHAGMRISNPEFDAAIGDLKASLDKLQIPNKEQKELLAIVESTRPQIVTQR
jgi:hemoglobin